MDVTVISTLHQQTVDGAPTTPGYSLKIGKDRKMAAHAEACHSIGVNFTPLYSAGNTGRVERGGKSHHRSNGSACRRPHPLPARLINEYVSLRVHFAGSTPTFTSSIAATAAS